MDRINKINRIGAEGRQGDFDRRDMRADEGDLFRQIPSRLFLTELCFQPRSGCKTLSHTPAYGRVYLRKPLRVGGGGEKVDFFKVAVTAFLSAQPSRWDGRLLLAATRR